jgi:hypothetical protein
MDRFRPSEPSRVPGELLAIYAAQRRTIVSVSVRGDEWKITSDTGRTVVWSRVDRVRPWRARLEVSHAE